MAGESALGNTLGGVGNVIGAVGSLLPTTTSQSGSYQNQASASSSTIGVQGNINANTAVQDILTNLVNKSQSSQTEAGKSTGRTTQSGTSSAVESFSGQQNQTMQQTLLTDPAVMRIVNLMFQGDGGVPGLQQVASGERNAGVFNSSTNQLLLNNLITTVAGEVARISAPVVTNQNLGATSTAQSGESSVVADTINNILNQLSSGTTQEQTQNSQSTEDSIAQLLSFALQGTEQESESKGTSKTKGKSSRCKVLALVGILSLPQSAVEVQSIREFRDTYGLIVYPDEVQEYYDSTAKWSRAFERLDMNTQYRIAYDLYTTHLVSLHRAYRSGNNQLAHYHYTQLINRFKVISGEA